MDHYLIRALLWKPLVSTPSIQRKHWHHPWCFLNELEASETLKFRDMPTVIEHARQYRRAHEDPLGHHESLSPSCYALEAAGFHSKHSMKTLTSPRMPFEFTRSLLNFWHTHCYRRSAVSSKLANGTTCQEREEHTSFLSSTTDPYLLHADFRSRWFSLQAFNENTDVTHNAFAWTRSFRNTELSWHTHCFRARSLKCGEHTSILPSTMDHYLLRAML